MCMGSQVERNRMSDKTSTVRRCKNIRDRLYDRDQLPPAVFNREFMRVVSSESAILDIGCGRDALFLRRVSPLVKKAYGIDPEVITPVTDGNMEVLNGSAEAMPFSDQSVDVITMGNVAEHLPNPGKVLLECKRVLKPGGILLLTAPSKYHLPIILGRAIPHRIRQWANSVITETKVEDTFPAYYRANSARALRRLAASVGLQAASIRYLSNHPQYFMFSTFAYRCAVVFERYVLRRRLFSCFRQQILCQLVKPCVAEAK